MHMTFDMVIPRLQFILLTPAHKDINATSFFAAVFVIVKD